MRIPYLRPEHMDPENQLVPNTPRILRPMDYCVIDGDTIWALGERGEDGKRPCGFSIRLRTISLPERTRDTQIDKAMRKLGIDTDITTGDLAKMWLKTKLRGQKYSEARSILVIPSRDPITGGIRKDKYNRLIGDVYVSGKPGNAFEIANAESVEEIMIKQGHATLNTSEVRAEMNALRAVRNFSGLATRKDVSDEKAFDDPDM